MGQPASQPGRPLPFLLRAAAGLWRRLGVRVVWYLPGVRSCSDQDGEARRHACIVDPANVTWYERQSQEVMREIQKGVRSSYDDPGGT